MAEQKQFKRGTSVYLPVTVRDVDDLLTTPATVTVTISVNAGAAVISAVAMTRKSLGKYYYVYQSAVDAVAGWYDVLVTAVTTTGHTVKYEILKSFELTS